MKVCSIDYYTFLPSFGQFMNIMPVKIIHANHSSSLFLYLCTNQSTAQQMRDQLMQTSSNQKESSLVSKPHGVEFPSWVLSTWREPLLSYAMEHCHEKKWLCVVSFGILSLQLMKAIVLAESSIFILFHCDLSAPAMSTDMSQVGVTIFPSF